MPLESLYRKWEEKKLTTTDILEKVREYASTMGIPLTGDEAESIAQMIYGMYLKYHDPKEVISDFPIALARDSLKRALWAADNTNTRAIAVYHVYLYNNAPGDWRERMLI